MTPGNEFFLIFFCTVLITRVLLYFKPIPSPTVGGFRTHHYMYGIIAIAVGFFTHSIILYAIGLGLFIDELAYLIIRGKTHADNYSTRSLCGTLGFVFLVFIFREYFIFLML
jgi:uncharacterized membrane protein